VIGVPAVYVPETGAVIESVGIGPESEEDERGGADDREEEAGAGAEEEDEAGHATGAEMS
jgi:hypothetical protein